MRKTHLLRQRERQKSFNVSFHVNDKPLPTYDALSDPYLEGFFDKPKLKKHLRQNGMFRTRKRKSYFVSPSQKPKTASKSRYNGQRSKSPDLRLPALQELMEVGQSRDIKTANSRNRRKHFFHSKKSSDLF